MTGTGITLVEKHRLRLAAQQVTGSRCTSPGTVVAWLGAVQAQDYPMALWSIGLRLPGSTAMGIGQAVSDKILVRTWLMRGTLHLVSAKDIRWMLALLAPGVIYRNRRRYRELGLDDETFALSNGVIADALESERHLTRTNLVAILEQNGISAAGQRAPYILQRASLDGLVCQGIPQGNNPTFFSLASLADGKIFGRAEALAELASRYFSSHGPATLRDFAGWSGLGVNDARAGIDAASLQVAQRMADNRTFFMSRSPRPDPNPPATVYLLPGFDEYILGYRDRSAISDDPKIKKMIVRNGMPSPTIIIDGQVAGTWKRTFRNGRVSITTHPFIPLTDNDQEALAITAHRYGEFLGMPVVLD